MFDAVFRRIWLKTTAQEASSRYVESVVKTMCSKRVFNTDVITRTSVHEQSLAIKYTQVWQSTGERLIANTKGWCREVCARTLREINSTEIHMHAG